VKRKKFKSFEEWINDPKNYAALMREAERQGLVETFIGPDGKVWCRRTAKQTCEEPSTGGLDS
jgi:hypothetical protein